MKRTLIACALAGVCLPGLPGQRRHPRPSATAARAGSHLPWQRSLETALEAAKAAGRRVLWYVPTVPGSPMDRRPVLDLYMMAGFFSDPDLEGLLKEFVLLERAPSRATARRYDLRPFRFVEPGFLVLDAEGQEVDRAHGITTFSPAWLARRLQRWLPPAAKEDASPVARLRRERLTGRPDVAREEASKLAAAEPSPEVTVQRALLALGRGDVAAARKVLGRDPKAPPRVRFLEAAVEFLSGRQKGARGLWRALAEEHPDHPLGWRAAAEAEGFGPVARGFWTWRDLPLRASEDLGTRVACTAQDVAILRQRSVEFLLRTQDAGGGWEDSNYDFGGQDSLPNVWVAVSAICCAALLESRDVAPGACEEAVRRGLRYVLDPASTNPRDRNEWIWARVYVIDLLARILRSEVTLTGWPKERLRTELEVLVADVFTRQGRDGSFRHEYSNPFATAVLLVALDDARTLGVEPPEEPLRRAVASLERCRSRRGAFSYGQVRGSRRPSTRVAAAAGRMPLCEAALLAWGKSDEARLEAALVAAFEHHEQLESTRRYDDHANSLAYGGFFFWFDMLGREHAFRRLGTKAAPWRAKQRALILQIPEIDGCFVDSHEVGRCYGTAMALLCLGR